MNEETKEVIREALKSFGYYLRRLIIIPVLGIFEIELFYRLANELGDFTKNQMEAVILISLCTIIGVSITVVIVKTISTLIRHFLRKHSDEGTEHQMYTFNDFHVDELGYLKRNWEYIEDRYPEDNHSLSKNEIERLVRVTTNKLAAYQRYRSEENSLKQELKQLEVMLEKVGEEEK